MRNSPRTAPIAAGVTATALAAVATLTLGAAAAAGAERSIGAGALTWGVKESFRNYVAGPGGGEITVADGAVRNEDGTFTWPVAGGSYDADGAVGEVRATGTVRFTAHGGALEVVIRDPRVELGTGGALLRADVQSRELGGGTPKEYPNVDLAVLEAGVTNTGDGVAMDAVGATLTENGAPAFGGFYPPGAALDPVSLDASYAKVAKPQFKGSAKPRRLGPDRTATIGRLICKTGPCEVKAPKRTKVRIGGDRYGARVKVAKEVAEGKAAALTVKVSRKAVKALGDGTAKVRVKLRVQVAGEEFTRRVRAKLKA